MGRDSIEKGKGGRNNVRVVCRVRPESEAEKLKGSSCVRVQHDTVSVQVSCSASWRANGSNEGECGVCG